MAGASAATWSSCRGDPARRRGGETTLVFKHQPLGESNALRELLDDFERRHPGVRIETEALPN
ncbi:MAG: hypothetical protein ABW133_20800, partial [Polyangiaceae bacterium]